MCLHWTILWFFSLVAMLSNLKPFGKYWIHYRVVDIYFSLVLLLTDDLTKFAWPLCNIANLSRFWHAFCVYSHVLPTFFVGFVSKESDSFSWSYLSNSLVGRSVSTWICFILFHLVLDYRSTLFPQCLAAPNMISIRLSCFLGFLVSWFRLRKGFSKSRRFIYVFHNFHLKFLKSPLELSIISCECFS